MRLKTMLRGFTLIEMMVSLAIFTIVMLVAAGAYLEIIALNQQAEAIASSADNLSYGLENMTREIKTGSAYACTGLGGTGGTPCTSGTVTETPVFSFVDPTGVKTSYTLSNGAITETQFDSETDTYVSTQVTDPTVVQVTSLEFFVQGTYDWDNLPDDYLQPQVTITITGNLENINSREKAQPFTIETGATMRGIDI